MSQARILIVDDYRDAVDVWGLYLRTLGHDVLTATNGLEAVAMAKEFVPDVIVLDLGLPGISGLEAARRIRRYPATAHIPLIAATGMSQLATRDEMRLAPFDAVLIKPCEPAQLLDEIGKSLMRARSGIVAFR